MVRTAVLLLVTALLCCRNTTLSDQGGGVLVGTTMVIDPAPQFLDLVLATRFAGSAAGGTVTDRWRARSTGSGWCIVALPEPRSTSASGLCPDLWLGLARKSSDREDYDFLLVRWQGLRPIEAQVGRLEGGRDAKGERRRSLRPWQAERLDLRTGATLQQCGELLLGGNERTLRAGVASAIH